MIQEKILKRPRGISVAVVLFIASHAINDILRISKFGVPLRVSYFIALAMVWVPVLLISTAAYRGKNWGRMLIAAFTIFGACYLPWSLPPVVGTQMEVVQLTQAALCVLATVLLFLPAARLWFRSIKAVSVMASAS
jgi:hypothetical protein